MSVNAQLLAEVWKQIENFPKYQVSNKGRVKHAEKGLLNPYTMKSGHFFVSLSNKGKRRTAAVHNLVAELFLGNRPPGYIVHHNDEDKSNNNAVNLEYISRKGHGHKHKDQNRKPFKAIYQMATHLDNGGKPLCRPLRKGYLLIDDEKAVTCLCCLKALGIVRKGAFGVT